MICPNCGKEINGGLKFCTECGHKLENAAAAPASPVPVPPAPAPETPKPSVNDTKKEKKAKKEKVKSSSSKPKWYRFMIWFSVLGMALFGGVDGAIHLVSGLPEKAADFADTASYGTLCTLFGVILVVCAALSLIAWFVLVIRSWIVPYTTAVTCLLVSAANFLIYFVSKWKIKDIFASNGFYYAERLILAVAFVVLALFNFLYFKAKKGIIEKRME